MNISGLNVLHPMNSDIFPYSEAGWCNVGDRLQKLYHVMQDAVNSIIKYDHDDNTVIKINEADIIQTIFKGLFD